MRRSCLTGTMDTFMSVDNVHGDYRICRKARRGLGTNVTSS